MQISLAMRIASRARSFTLSFVCFSSARAPESAYIPPDPIAQSPSSGSITSPLPETTKVAFASATISSASRCRKARSLRHSFASSTAAFCKFPECSCNLPSKRSNSEIASAVDPANPAITLSLYKRRVFRAVCFSTWSPMVTCPSAIRTTLVSFRTHKTVVPCLCASSAGRGISQVYRDRPLRSWLSSDRNVRGLLRDFAKRQDLEVYWRQRLQDGARIELNPVAAHGGGKRHRRCAQIRIRQHTTANRISRLRNQHRSIKLADTRSRTGDYALSHHQNDALPRCVRIVDEVSRYQQQSVPAVVPRGKVQIPVNNHRHRRGGPESRRRCCQSRSRHRRRRGSGRQHDVGTLRHGLNQRFDLARFLQCWGENRSHQADALGCRGRRRSALVIPGVVDRRRGYPAHDVGLVRQVCITDRRKR